MTSTPWVKVNQGLEIDIQVFQILRAKGLFVPGNNGILSIGGNIDEASAEAGHPDNEVLMFLGFLLSSLHFCRADHIKLDVVNFEVVPCIHVGLPDVEAVHTSHNGHRKALIQKIGLLIHLNCTHGFEHSRRSFLVRAHVRRNATIISGLSTVSAIRSRSCPGADLHVKTHSLAHGKHGTPGIVGYLGQLSSDDIFIEFFDDLISIGIVITPFGRVL